MPLKTFLNLPQERQKKILDICFEEFALNDYDSASLSQIIKKTGVAKGSFYRYFENKKDLYQHLCSISLNRMLENFHRFLENPDYDFFDAWVQYLLANLELEKDYPMSLRFLSRFSLEKNRKHVDVSSLIGSQGKFGILESAIVFHQKRGTLRNDIQPIIIARLLRKNMEAFHEHLAERYHLDFDKRSTAAFPIFTVNSNTLMTELEPFLKILKTGVSTPEK